MVGGRGVGKFCDAVPRLAELIAVEARLRSRDLGIGPFWIVVAAGIVLVGAPDRLVAHQVVDRGVGGGEVFHFDGGVELAVARLDVLRTLRQHPLVGFTCSLGPLQIKQCVGVGLLGILRQGAVRAEGLALLDRLLHAHAIAQGHHPVEPEATAQSGFGRRRWQGRQQLVEPGEGGIGAVEAACRIGAADLGAPTHHGGGLIGGNRRRPGARDHLGAKGRAHVLQHTRRFERARPGWRVPP